VTRIPLFIAINDQVLTKIQRYNPVSSWRVIYTNTNIQRFAAFVELAPSAQSTCLVKMAGLLARVNHPLMTCTLDREGSRP